MFIVRRSEPVSLGYGFVVPGPRCFIGFCAFGSRPSGIQTPPTFLERISFEILAFLVFHLRLYQSRADPLFAFVFTISVRTAPGLFVSKRSFLCVSGSFNP